MVLAFKITGLAYFQQIFARIMQIRVGKQDTTMLGNQQ